MAISTLDRYRSARYNAWQWRRDLSWVKKVGIALGLACLVGLSAQIQIPLPWTPVPITAQTFTALLAAVVLGRWWGGASLGMYVGLGAAGVPWFNGFAGGLARIAGPTGGYIIGFIIAALFLGFFVDKFVKARNFPSLWLLMFFADFVLIFGPGLIQLRLWLGLTGNQAIGIYQLLTMGLLPFIGGEIVKITAAAVAAWVLVPKKEHSPD